MMCESDPSSHGFFNRLLLDKIMQYTHLFIYLNVAKSSQNYKLNTIHQHFHILLQCPKNNTLPGEINE
jgi:uncharacterized membrane protein